MNKTVVMLLGLLFCIGAAYSYAAESAEEFIPLTLNDAIKMGLKNHIDLRLEDAKVEGAQAKVSEAYSAFYPTLDLSIDQQRSEVIDKFSGVGITGTIEKDPVTFTIDREAPRYLVSSQLTGRLNLYAGGLHVAKVGEAEAERKAATAQRVITRNRLILNLATAYWELRKAQIVYSNTLRTTKFAREEARWADSQYQQGQISEIEMTTKVFNLAEKEILETQGSQQLKEKSRQYILILGLPYDGEGTVEIKNLVDEPASFNIKETPLVYTAERQPELLKYQAELSAASLQTRMVQAERLPSVDLYGNYSTGGRAQNGLGDAWTDIKGQQWVVGVSASWNLFNGFQTRQRIAKARLEETVALLSMVKIQKELSNEFSEKLARVRTVESELELAQKRLTLSHAQERIAQVRWEIQQINKVQYDAAKLDRERLASQVTVVSIDLALARIVLSLATDR